MNRNRYPWWDSEFWSTNTPPDHFDTPGTLCAPLLARWALNQTQYHKLTGILDVGCGTGNILLDVGRMDPGMFRLGVDRRPVTGLPEEQFLELQWDCASESWHGPRGEEALVERLRRSGPVLLLATEWLDDLPATVAWRSPDGRAHALTPDLRTAALDSADEQWLARWWPQSGRAVVGRTRDRAWRWLARRLAPGSLLVTVDYGHVRADRPPDGGLLAHRAGEPVPPQPSANVTAGPAVDSLAAAVEAVGAERLHLTRLADLPAGFWPIASDRALTGLALRSQEQLLRDRSRFGGFWLVAHRIGAAPHP